MQQTQGLSPQLLKLRVKAGKMSTPKHGEEPKTFESVAADFLHCEISVTAVTTMTLRGL